MIPPKEENAFKRLKNTFVRLQKGIYQEDKDAMQRIYNTMESICDERIHLNPLLFKLLSVLMIEYTISCGNPKDAVALIHNKMKDSVDLNVYKIKSLINQLNTLKLNESFEKGEITQEQLSFAIKQNEGFFTEQHIHRSLVGLANELILKTNKHEL